MGDADPFLGSSRVRSRVERGPFPLRVHRPANRWSSPEYGPADPTLEIGEVGRTERTTGQSASVLPPRADDGPRVAGVPGALECPASPGTGGRQPACRPAPDLPAPCGCRVRRSPRPDRPPSLRHRGTQGRRYLALRGRSRRCCLPRPSRAHARARCPSDPRAGLQDRGRPRTRCASARRRVQGVRPAAPDPAGEGCLHRPYHAVVGQIPGLESAAAGTPPSDLSPSAAARHRSRQNVSRSATIASSVFSPVASTERRRTSRQNSSASA